MAATSLAEMLTAAALSAVVILILLCSAGAVTPDTLLPGGVNCPKCFTVAAERMLEVLIMAFGSLGEDERDALSVAGRQALKHVEQLHERWSELLDS